MTPLRPTRALLAALLLAAGASARNLKGSKTNSASSSSSSSGGPAIRSATPKGSNIFKENALYVNPYFQEELDGTIKTASGGVKRTLESIRGLSSAYWLDVKSKVQPGGWADTHGERDYFSLEGILKDAASKSPPQAATFIVYDLPNRDCHARASNGEICCTYKPDGTCDYEAPGDCAAGLKEYKEKYIDPLVQVLKKYQDRVPIALVIEPDSLPNLSTNAGDPRCGSKATKTAYTEGVKYAINAIASKAPGVTMYLDVSHGGWLGWEHSLEDYLDIIAKLDVVQHVRGFATNTANYQAIGKMCPQWDWCLGGKHADDECCADPCKLASQYNAGNNEMNYALMIYNKTTTRWPEVEPRFIMDTGRNGKGDMRKSCSNWCNIRGAGIGHRPTTDTGSPLVDAFLWLKTPGESDGCTQILPLLPGEVGQGKQCPRFDSMCGSEDSIGSLTGEPRAPEAGRWFDYQIKELAANAKLD